MVYNLTSRCFCITRDTVYKLAYLSPARVVMSNTVAASSTLRSGSSMIIVGQLRIETIPAYNKNKDFHKKEKG